MKEKNLTTGMLKGVREHRAVRKWPCENGRPVSPSVCQEGGRSAQKRPLWRYVTLEREGGEGGEGGRGKKERRESTDQQIS